MNIKKNIIAVFILIGALFPVCIYIKREMQIIQSFNHVKSTNTLEEYQRFLDKYNDLETKYKDSCRINMSTLYEHELYQCSTIKDYQMFVKRYASNLRYSGSHDFVESAKSRIIEMKDSILYVDLQKQLRKEQQEPILLLQDFITQNPKSNYLDSCETLIKDIYQDGLNKSSGDIDSLSLYIEKYESPIFYGKYKEKYIGIAQVKMKSFEWITDENAWRTVKKAGDIFSFRRYLFLYPDGKHSNEANKIIIDLEVDNIFSGSYGELPKMNREFNDQESSRTTITAENRTSYVLTLLYSGPESKRLTINPFRTQSITLVNGHYRIAASVNATNVSPFAGSENLSGGNYSASYYIETSYRNNKTYW
ncbi:hypothetical protein ACPYIV_20185 [Parabacteroides sp. ASD2025]|uniref:hypothetical protein n=1 Tax=Parabacteroides sp. ASD2025 TaxID=3415987 RepID=UPI003CEA0A91